MTEFFKNITQSLASAVGHWVGGAIAVILLGAAVILGLKYLSKNAQDARFLMVILKIGKAMLEKRLGEKGNAIFDAVLAGLNSIQDGEFSQDEMAEELTRFVQVAVMGKFDLSEQDLSTVREVCGTLIGFFEPRKEAAPKAVKVMMIMQAK